MSFSHDRRGQSVVVGTVILFGFLILALSIYQVQFVPAENSEIEFEHSQQVEGDFQDLRNGILQAGSTGTAQSQRIRLGTRYPQRTFFLNPPAATGELRSVETGEIEVRNVEVDVNKGADENARDFWAQVEPTYETRSLQYTPEYNEYREGPTLTYEHSTIAAEFPNDAVLLRSNQTVLRDDRISLIALTGQYAERGVEPRSVDPEAVSQGTRTVPITAESDAEIVLPTAVENATRLAERWDSRFSSLDVSVDDASGPISVSLQQGETYRLRLAEVALDDAERPEPAYIVPIGPETVVSGQSIGVEVRDRYNNPVEGAPVEIDDEEFRTDDDGRVFTEITEDVVAKIHDGGGFNETSFTVTDTAETANRTLDVQWDNSETTLTVGDDPQESGTVTVRHPSLVKPHTSVV